MVQKVVRFREIKSVADCRYDGLSLGEVMLRLGPVRCADGQSGADAGLSRRRRNKRCLRDGTYIWLEECGLDGPC